jgi:hypothetical protein
MASIITATTTSGLTQSADNSGVLQLASGTGNLVTVPSVTGTAMVSGNMPAFSAYASAGTSLSNATFTKVNYATEIFDTNNNFASSRFTPTVAGYYQISAVTRLGSITASIIAFKLFKNGLDFVVGGSCGVSSGYVYPFISTLVYANGSTDYFEIYCYQNSGSSTTTDAGADYTFTGVLVRAA